MRSIIFANYLARDTMRLGATIDVEHSHVRFLGNLVLNLWDCGGQEAFMENYFESQRDHIFRNVQVLIYVFDIESRELAKDMEYYASCLQAVKHNSQNAKIFCLVHKMDLIPEEQRDQVCRAPPSLPHPPRSGASSRPCTALACRTEGPSVARIEATPARARWRPLAGVGRGGVHPCAAPPPPRPRAVSLRQI